MKETKYLRQAMTEAYLLLVTSKKPWPVDFSKEKKLVVLKGILEFFQDEEEYEKCVLLKKLITKLEKIQPKKI